MSNVLKPLAPKISKKTSEPLVSSTTNNTKRRKAFHPTLGYAIPPPIPAKVARRNARERNRVKQVNCGFEMLRTHIPSAAKHKKMSKVDTLRHAVEYIESLTRMLNRNETMSEIDSETSSSSPDPLMKVETPTSPLPPASTPEAQQTVLPSTPAPPMPYNENYESGYETSSYYSTCNSMISPQPGYNTGYSEYNPPAISDQRHYYYNHHHHQALPSASRIEPNSEEDELLDAIANWQDS